MQTLTKPKTPASSKLPPTRGARVCKFIESFLIHAEGDWYGKPFRLRTWQKSFIWRCYELNEDGTRKYRRVLKGLPKGNGKTELAAAIACYELLGGDTPSPVIPVAAASFEQADLLFGAAKVMLGEGSLAHLVEVFDKEILIKGAPGRMYRVAAAAGTNDGQRPTFACFDELHEFVGSKERVHLVLSNGLAKRQNSWELCITTAGYDKDSLLGRLYDYGVQVRGGEINDPGFLFDWDELPDDADLTTDEGLLRAVKAANVAADDFWPADNLVRRYKEIPEFEWLRYHGNRWTESGESWLPAGTWEASRTQHFELSPDLPTFVGVDSATKHDSHAQVYVQWDQDKLKVKAKIWERPTGPDGRPVDEWKLPIAEVENYLRDQHKKLNLQAVAYDPALFERSAQQLEVEGLPMIEFPQSDSRMVPACQATYELLVQDRLRHDGDPVLARHIASAAAVEARNGGWRLRKAKSKAKMDAAIALVLAVDMAVDQVAESVYESRGMVTL